MMTKELMGKVEDLEQQLLAISSLNDIFQRCLDGNIQHENLASCTELLNHLIEPAMYQVEAVRMQIKEMMAVSESEVNGGANVLNLR